MLEIFTLGQMETVIFTTVSAAAVKAVMTITSNAMVRSTIQNLY